MYARNYGVPDELERLSPSPPLPPAGVSSSKISITHEPSFTRKKKDERYTSERTFTTEYKDTENHPQVKLP